MSNYIIWFKIKFIDINFKKDLILFICFGLYGIMPHKFEK